MKCIICGKPFRPKQKTQVYCSPTCRNKAKVVARHAKAKGERVAQALAAGRTPSKPRPDTSRPDLSRDEFKRMMDESLEDVLRRNRDRLSQALDDPDTPANALAAISRQLIAVVERLDRLEGGDPLLDAPEGDAQDVTQEAEDDAGKAIV